MNPRIRSAAQLSAAAVLTGFTMARLLPLPWRAPSTPYDLSIPAAAREFRFLRDAAPFIPMGAKVIARWEPPNPSTDDSLSRIAVALLPGREVIPSATWRIENPNADDRAEYLVVMGGRPSGRAFDLVFEASQGAVWKRRTPTP